MANKRRRQRRAAKAERWADDDGRPEEGSDSQRHEAAEVLLGLNVPDQDQGDTNEDGAASRDSNRHGPALGGDVGDGLESGQATPPMPLFLEQDDPEAFHASVKMLPAHRGQTELAHHDTTSNTGAGEGHGKAQDWPPLGGDGPEGHNGARNAPSQLMGVVGGQTQPLPWGPADHVHPRLEGQPTGRDRQCREMPAKVQGPPRGDEWTYVSGRRHKGGPAPLRQPLAAERPTEVAASLHQRQLREDVATMPQADVGAVLQGALSQMSVMMAASQEQTSAMIAATREQTSAMMAASQEQTAAMMAVSQQQTLDLVKQMIHPDAPPHVHDLGPRELDAQARVLEAIHHRETFRPPPSVLEARVNRSGGRRRQEGPPKPRQWRELL